MNAWAVLGIPPGSDRDAVRRAYAAKLKQTNPEDDPAGFMKLREAYEWVLRWGHLDTAADADDGDDEEADDEGDGAPDGMDFGGTGIRNPLAIIEDRQDRPLDPRWADAGEEEETPPRPLTPDRWAAPPERAEAEWAEHPDFDPEPRPDEDPVWDEEDRDGATGPWGDRAGHARGGDIDLAEFNRRIQALADCLSGNGPRDDARAAALFDALMQSAALLRLDLRARAEQNIAALIADTMPRSDAVLRQAVKAFGWNDAGRRDLTPAMAAVQQRMDDWRVIAGLNQSSHKLHQGWKALTRPLPGWPQRNWLDRATVRAQVRQLLNEIEWSAPGLAWSIPPENLDWWRARMERTPFRLGLVVPLLLMACLFGVRDVMGDDRAGEVAAQDWLGLGIEGVWLGAGLCIGFALLDLALSMTAVPALEARYWTSPAPARWFRFGWVAPLALLPPLALLAPRAEALTWGLIAAILPMFVWMRLAREPEEGEGRRNPFIYLLLLSVGAIVLGSSWEVAWPLRLLMMALATLLVLAADPLRWPLLRAISVGPRGGWPEVVASLYLSGLGGLAMVAVADRWVQPIYAAAIWAVSANLFKRTLEGRRGRFTALWRWLVNGLMIVALVFAIGEAAGNRLPDRDKIEAAQSVGDAIVAIQRPAADPALENAGLRGVARQAMAAMPRTNPMLYAQIRAELAKLDALSDADDRWRTANAIDKRIEDQPPVSAPPMPFSEQRAWMRLRVDILMDMRSRDLAGCAAGKLTLDEKSSDDLRRLSAIHTLHVISGFGDPMTGVRGGHRLTVAEAKARKQDIRERISALPAPKDGVSKPDQWEKCDDRLARAMLLNELNDADLKATLMPDPPANKKGREKSLPMPVL